MTDFANIVWNPKNLVPVVIHGGIALTNLPPDAYIMVTTGGAGDIVTDMDPMTLVNMIKPKYYLTSEKNEELFKFCKNIGVEVVFRPDERIISFLRNKE